MTPKELATILDQILDDDLLPGLERAFIRASKTALADIIALLNDLKLTKTGQIKPTTENLRKIQKIKSQLNTLLFNTNYNEGLDHIRAGFELSMDQINNYYRSAFAGFKPTEQMKQSILIGIEAVEQTIGSSGLGATVANLVANTLNEAVTTGMPLRDLVAGISDILIPEAFLQVSRFNIKQIVTDALGALKGSYLKQAADRIGYKWFQYIGGVINTTRPFCEARNNGYFHEDEIRSWASLNWAGKMEGTNAANIFLKRGGWNCRHHLPGVSEDIVPDSDKMRHAEFLKENRNG